MGAIVLIVGAVAIAANVLATRLLLRAEDLETSQRRAQLVLVWLLPVVGAVTVTALRREFQRTHRQQSSFPESSITNNDAVDLAISIRQGSRQHETEVGPE